MTRDPWLYFPSEGSHTQDFYALKNPSTPPGIKPANLGSRGKYDNHWTTGVDYHIATESPVMQHFWQTVEGASSQWPAVFFFFPRVKIMSLYYHIHSKLKPHLHTLQGNNRVAWLSSSLPNIVHCHPHHNNTFTYTSQIANESAQLLSTVHHLPHHDQIQFTLYSSHTH